METVNKCLVSDICVCPPVGWLPYSSGLPPPEVDTPDAEDELNPNLTPHLLYISSTAPWGLLIIIIIVIILTVRIIPFQSIIDLTIDLNRLNRL